MSMSFKGRLQVLYKDEEGKELEIKPCKNFAIEHVEHKEKELESVTFVFETTDRVTIPEECIVGIYVGDVTETRSYIRYANCNEWNEHKVFRNGIIALRVAGVSTLRTMYGDDFMHRIHECVDITHVEFKFNDGSTDIIRPVWFGESDYSNSNQSWEERGESEDAQIRIIWGDNERD